MTALTVVAGKYGTDQLVKAITGNSTVADLAGEFFAALAASEARIDVRLADIEEKLAEVLEQRYRTAIGAGVRGLLDAGTCRDASARAEDFMQARERFRDATAAARSPLQTALAERYLLICALALEREDAARTALAQMNVAITTELFRLGRIDRGSRSLRTSRARAIPMRRREPENSRAGVEAAANVVDNLLRESGVLGANFGRPPMPDLVRTMGAMHWKANMGDLDSVGIGALVVQWRSMTTVWEPQFLNRSLLVRCSLGLKVDTTICDPLPAFDNTNVGKSALGATLAVTPDELVEYLRDSTGSSCLGEFERSASLAPCNYNGIANYQGDLSFDLDGTIEITKPLSVSDKYA